MYQKECTSDTAADGETDDVEEFVEQEGCPNEEDFNKWSHHCSPNTCDDEALKKALNDDTTVSFVFGLEVNWSLLQEKLALEMEADEKRKEQQRIDLLELNARRARERQKQGGEIPAGAADLTSSDEASDDSDDDDTEEVKQSGTEAKRAKKRSLDPPAEPKRVKVATGDRRRSRKEEQKEKAERVTPMRAPHEASAKKRLLANSSDDDDSEGDFAVDPPERKPQQRRQAIASSEESDDSSAAEEGKAPVPVPSPGPPLSSQVIHACCCPERNSLLSPLSTAGDKASDLPRAMSRPLLWIGVGVSSKPHPTVPSPAPPRKQQQ
jgi:hypothetical protein